MAAIVWKWLLTMHNFAGTTTGKATELKKGLLVNGGFVLALAILIVIGWLNYLNIKGMLAEERWEHHTYAVAREYDELMSALQDVETGERGFVITNRETFLEPYHAAVGHVDQLLARIRSLTEKDSRHEDHLVGIEPLIREKLANSGKIIALRRTAGFQSASRLVATERGKNLMDGIRRKIDVARSEEERLLNRMNSVENARIRKSVRALIGGSIVSFSLLVMVFLLLKREIAQRGAAEEELRTHRDHLEELVHERTVLLEQAKHEAESANLVKSQFLENMSHEMRTPLTGVMGVIDLMLTEKLTDKHRHTMEMAKSAAELLKGLINDFLDFSTITSGKVRFERLPFNLRQCIHSVTDIFAVRAELKGLRFSLEIGEHLPVQVTGDEQRLRQVLENLLRNALKFTASGEIDVSVQEAHAPGQPEEGVLLFTVRDTGTGIPAEYMENIFEIFTQADTSSTKRFGGIGLGLALTKQIVENLGGKIEAESRQGEGSLFSFTLPLPGEQTSATST